jgi:hypothetical protein
MARRKLSRRCRSSGRRNRKKLLIRSPAPRQRIAVRSKELRARPGPAASDSVVRRRVSKRARGHPRLRAQKPTAIRVNVAASGASVLRGESPPHSGAPDPRPFELAGNGRRSGRDPRNGSGMLCVGVTHAGTGRKARSEIPRPSSRETAEPPCWVSHRGGKVAMNRLYRMRRKAHSMLIGPRRAQAGSRLPKYRSAGLGKKPWNQAGIA